MRLASTFLGLGTPETSFSRTRRRALASPARGLAGATGMTPAAGALPQLRAATDPGARGGEFYAPRFGNFGAPVRRPILRRLGLSKAIERLWQVSERETKLRIDVEAARSAA